MRGQGLASLRRPVRSGLAALAAVAGALALVAATDPAEVTLAQCGRAVEGWLELPHPPIGKGLVDVAADPRAPGRVLATDGIDLASSIDGGCSWRQLSRPDTPADATRVDLAISDVEIGHQPDGTVRLWALGFVEEGAVNRPPVLFRSDDAGASWVRLAEDIGRARPFMDGDCGPGETCGLHTVPDRPDTIILRMGDQVTSGVIYISDDAGETFERATPLVLGDTDTGDTPTRGLLPPGMRDLDMVGRDLAVGVGYDSVELSTDGARTFHAVIERDFGQDTVQVAGGNIDLSPIGLDDDALVALATVREQGVPDHLVASVIPGAGLLSTVTPGGRILAIDVAASGAAVVLTEGLGVSAFPIGAVFGEPIHLGGPPDGGHDALQVVGTAEQSTLWLHGSRGIARQTVDLALPVPDLPDGPEIGLPDFDPAVPLGPVPGTLQPSVEALQLEPGEAAQVAYDLVVPERPLPVDVFFLFDESGSMGQEIEALRKGVSDIVDELQARGLDVWVGVGGYAREWRYERYREIGPPDAEFKGALAQVGRCCQEWDEIAYTALHQIATGSGIEGGGARPGEDAEWRPGALRLVINLGDERLQEYPGDPTKGDAIEALRRQRIMHIGLVSEFELLMDSSGWYEVTAASGAFAGPSGVDCDNDGNLDVHPGGPILCFIPLVAQTDAVSEAVELIPDMAGVVVEVVDAVTEVVDISFHTDRPDVVTELVSEPRLTSYDLHSGVAASLRATMTCSEALFGQSFPVRVTAVAHASHLATSVVEFGCGVPPAPPAVVQEPSRPVVAAIAPAPAPAVAPPPAPPAQAVTSVSSTASSAAQAPAPGVQGAVAGAQQRQTQVQAAGLGRPAPRPHDATEFLATAASSRRSDPGPATVAMGAGLAAVAGAVELARRRARRGAGVPIRLR